MSNIIEFPSKTHKDTNSQLLLDFTELNLSDITITYNADNGNLTLLELNELESYKFEVICERTERLFENLYDIQKEVEHNPDLLDYVNAYLEKFAANLKSRKKTVD